MAELTPLDRAYHFIMKRMVETGVAPFYTEVAEELGISIEDGRQAVHGLVEAHVPGTWFAPSTDYLASFAPFSNIPTQYRVSVEGEQKWFGQ